MTTDRSGSFQFDCVLDGAYLLEASQPLYGSVKQQVEVRAADDDPPVVKFQLVRVILGTPYAAVDFDGLNLTDRQGEPVVFDASTRFSTMIWPNSGCADFGLSTDPDCLQQLNVALNQKYQMFATAFYCLPAPGGWSLLTDAVPA